VTIQVVCSIASAVILVAGSLRSSDDTTSCAPLDSWEVSCALTVAFLAGDLLPFILTVTADDLLALKEVEVEAEELELEVLIDVPTTPTGRGRGGKGRLSLYSCMLLYILFRASNSADPGSSPPPPDCLCFS
jgi:hypothetical protein